jgi:hypothetical protein
MQSDYTQFLNLRQDRLATINQVKRIAWLLVVYCLTLVLAFAEDTSQPYPLPSPAEQAQRKRQLLEMGKRWLQQYGRPLGQPAANYPANVPPPQGDAVALTQALLTLGGEAEVARAVETMAEIGPHNGEYGIFMGPAIMEIWFRYRERLPAPTRERLLKEIETISAPNGRLWGASGKNTAGGNWGFCAAATVGLAGEILGDQARLERGKDSLKLVLDQIHTYGTIVEYNSPTYYGPSFSGLAAISSHAKDLEFRGMADTIQTILLMQTLSLYHPPSEQVSGPWQRGYHWDVYGGPSATKSLLYPYLPRAPFMEMKHLWTFPAMVGVSSEMLSFGGTDIHFPPWLGMFVVDRPPVWSVSLTSHVPEVREARGLGTVYHEGDVHAEVYQTPIYTLGAASYVYHNGAHAETPYLAWALRVPVTQLSDFKTGFFRMLHHDVLVEGADNKSVFGKTAAGYVLWNEGRKFAYQQGPRAILFAHPDRLVPEASRLGLSFFVTELETPVDEIWLGGKRVEHLPTASSSADWLVVRDGRFYLALRPLPGNENLGTTDVIQIRRTSTKYLQVSFLNYVGERRSMQEWLYARNGVYLETADTSRFPDLQHFLAYLQNVHVEERVDGDLRSVTVTTPDGMMQTTYDRRQERFLTRQWNSVPYQPVAFRSPRSTLGLAGQAEVGNVRVVCDPPQPILLAADLERRLFVLLNYGNVGTQATLQLPNAAPRVIALHPYEERVISTGR